MGTRWIKGLVKGRRRKGFCPSCELLRLADELTQLSAHVRTTRHGLGESTQVVLMDVVVDIDKAVAVVTNAANVLSSVMLKEGAAHCSG